MHSLFFVMRSQPVIKAVQLRSHLCKKRHEPFGNHGAIIITFYYFIALHVYWLDIRILARLIFSVYCKARLWQAQCLT